MSMSQPIEDDYDVFLSYHDKDIANSFASDLYSALTQAGFVVYINNHNLTTTVDQTNFSAIQASRTSIIGFSKKWRRYWSVTEPQGGRLCLFIFM
jgi:hypothetical protein